MEYFAKQINTFPGKEITLVIIQNVKSITLTMLLCTLFEINTDISYFTVHNREFRFYLTYKD